MGLCVSVCGGGSGGGGGGGGGQARALHSNVQGPCLLYHVLGKH